MIEKVFQNLLDNALKFTPEQGTIKIYLSSEGNKNLVAKISVSGPGLNENEAKLLFDRYYQAKRTSSEKAGGSGLGLAIVKKIMDLHGFNIKVESELEKGTTFVLTFPVS